MTNGYTEMLRANYVETRVIIRDLVRHQAEVGKRLGVKAGDSVVKAFIKSKLGAAPPDGPASFPDDADASLARTTNTEMLRKIRELDRYYSAALAFDGVPYADRMMKAWAQKMAAGSDVLSRLITLLEPAIDASFSALARATASLHATECLLALRRWQLTGHRGARPIWRQ